MTHSGVHKDLFIGMFYCLNFVKKILTSSEKGQENRQQTQDRQTGKQTDRDTTGKTDRQLDR